MIRCDDGKDFFFVYLVLNAEINVELILKNETTYVQSNPGGKGFHKGPALRFTVNSGIIILKMKNSFMCSRIPFSKPTGNQDIGLFHIVQIHGIHISLRDIVMTTVHAVQMKRISFINKQQQNIYYFIFKKSKTVHLYFPPQSDVSITAL